MGNDDYVPENNGVEFGKMFSEVLRYYHQPYSEVMAMPWATFLMLIEWRNVRIMKEAEAMEKARRKAGI